MLYVIMEAAMLSPPDFEERGEVGLLLLIDVIRADDLEPSSLNEKLALMETRNKTSHPKLSQLGGTAMTLSGEEDGLVAEATQSLLDFAVTKGHGIQTVTHMTKCQLSDFLRDFYMKVKVKNDDSLTLKDLRAGLHKFFLDERNIDILRDRCFEPANATFDLALRANPRKCHRMRIEMDDLKKIYLSEAVDTNKPDSLQNKVFFDISLYICNKGKEHFRGMKKNDFDVSTDIHGRRYVWLKDGNSTAPREEELPVKLKLKRSLDEEPPYQIGERMYERPGDPRCPLASFLKYVTHLHPMIDAFWQRPKRNVSLSDYVWYDHAPLGSSTLMKIMQRISLQAGLSDNYTNFSIRSACIPLVEAVCEEAMQAESGGAPPTNLTSSVDIIKPAGPLLSHSASEDLSSDDSLSQTSDIQANHKEHDNRKQVMGKEKPPGISKSVESGSVDGDDVDLLGLMQAKTQVLGLIRGLLVKDIQKFVDWLKTVRVQYSNGELIVLCSPVEKSSVEPILDEPIPDRNGLIPHANSHSHPFKKSGSLELSEKRSCLKKELSLSEDGYGDKFEVLEMTGTTVKQVEFNSLSGVYCSAEELGPVKISIPSHDTILVTGITENLQVMLHKKRGPTFSQQSLPERVFCSENEMNVAEMVAILATSNHRTRHRSINSNISSTSSITTSSLNNYHMTAESQTKHQLTVMQNQSNPIMVTIPTAHSTVVSSLSAREHFKDNRNKSMGCLDQPPMMPQGATLKRVSSTGTPVLKRQANVIDSSMYPENLTVKRVCEEIQATNLSMKPLKKVESPEAKRARADRLADSLRYHQEILQNSPLIKRPGERNFSGFRHCYANTVSSAVKAEPLDTSYS